MIVDFRRNPPALPPLTIMNSTVAAVETFRFLGTTISQDLKWDNHIDSIVKKAQQRLYFLRQLRKFNLPQELLKQFYSAIIESVLCTSITVWFSSATKPQKTTEGSPDCWTNHWYNPPHSPRTVLIQSEQKVWQNHSGPLTSSTLPLCTVTVWAMLQSSEHQNDQTQEQFLPSGNPSHEHLTIIMVHTLLYTYLSNTSYLVCISIAHNIPVHTKLSTVIYLYMQLSICILLFLIYLFFFILLFIICFFVLSLSFCCTLVAYVTITNSSYV